MLKRDLIARYGEASHAGVQEKELRQALRFRVIAFGFFGLMGVSLFVGLYMIHPMAVLWALASAGAVGALLGLVCLCLWLIENWETQMGRIKTAKKYGVFEDK